MIPVANGWRTFALLLSLCAAAPGIASAQGCAANDPGCQAKAAAYRVFFDALGAGVSLKPLPAAYVQRLQGFYPRRDLGTVRLGYAQNIKVIQLNMTDCDKIYVGDSAFADRVASGKLTANNEMSVLYHELRHTEQCAEVGGRDAYGAMWFNQLNVAGMSQQAIHDAMPMEGDAAQRAAAVANSLPGGPYPKIAIASLAPSAPEPAVLGATVTWTAAATGGTGGPLLFAFSTHLRGASADAESRGPEAGNTFAWTPRTAGTYIVKVTVRDRDQTAFPAAERTERYHIAQRPPGAADLFTNTAGPRPVGTLVSWFTGLARGTPTHGVEYQFSVFRSLGAGDLGSWTVVQPYGTNESLDWTPREPGTYRVSVRVRLKATDDAPAGAFAETVSQPYVVTPLVAPAAPAAAGRAPSLDKGRLK